MTNDERLDRLERILTLIVRAGRRTRASMREETRRSVSEVDEKVSILINAQIKTDAEVKKLTANIKNLTEESKAMRKESKAMREDERVMREDVMAIRQDAIAMRDDLYQRSRDVFELFRLTDQKMARLAEVQTTMGQQLAVLIERLGSH